MWLGGVVVRALDSRWAGREFDSHAAAALSVNNLGQVVHTNVPLFTKQYNLVPCEGFHERPERACMWQPFMGSNEQGEYCSSGSEAIGSFRTAI